MLLLNWELLINDIGSIQWILIVVLLIVMGLINYVIVIIVFYLIIERLFYINLYY